MIRPATQKITIQATSSENFFLLSHWARAQENVTILQDKLPLNSECVFYPSFTQICDILLLDVRVPKSRLLAYLEALSSLTAPPIVLLLCNLENEKLALEFLDLGVTDYLFEDRLNKLNWYVQKISAQKFLAAPYEYESRPLRQSPLEEKELSAKAYHYLFKEIFNQAPSLLAVLATDGILLELNAIALRIIKLKLEEAVGKYFWELDWLKQNTSALEAVKEGVAAARRGKMYRNIFELGATGENKLYTIDLSITPLKDERKNVVCLLVEAKNISKIRKIEKKLEKYRLQLEHYILASNDGYFEINHPEAEYYFSPRWKQMLGYNEIEAPNSLSTLQNLIYPEDWPAFKQAIEKLQQRKIECLSAIYRFRHKKNTPVFILCKAIAVTGPKGKVKIVGAHTDITSLQKAQNALKQSQAKIDAIFTAMPDTVLLFDKAGNFVEYNCSHSFFAENITKESIGKPIEAIFPPLYWGAIETSMREAQTSGRLATLEISFLYQGTTLIFENRIIYDDNLGYLFVLRDITEKKKHESQLRSSWERLQLALDSAQIGIWDWDMLTQKVHFNQQWLTMMGYPKDANIQTFEFWQRHIYPEDLPKVKNSLENHIQGKKEQYKLNYRVLNKAGEIIWVNVNGKIVERDILGRPARMIGVQRNIHLQKLADIELKRSKLRLHLALKASQIVFCEWDLGTGQIFYEKGGWKELLNVDIHLLGNHYQKLIELFEEEDQKKLIVALEKYLQNKTYFESVELQLKKQDGTLIYVRVFALITEYNDNQDPARLTLTLHNIQKQKEMEAQIKAYEQTLLATVILQQDKEGARIAKLLHESAAQSLFAASLNLEKLSERFEENNPPQAYLALRENLQAAIEQIRNITYSIQPVELDEFGIAASLEKLITQIAREAGLEIDFACYLPPQLRLAYYFELSLYRIIQETLSDYIKFSQNKFLFILVSMRADKLILSFESEFSAAANFLERYSLGQTRLEARVRLLNGNILTKLNPQTGALLLIELPLHPAPLNAALSELTAS
jgi:PAS domain S-box-containing protein